MVKAKAAPKPLYYALVDGTDFVDSATFGADLEKGTAFRNIATEFLKPAAIDPARLLDPAHPDFPIWRVKASGATAVSDAAGVAVLAPAGLNGNSQGAGEGDAYKGDETKYGPSGDFIEDWFFEPAVTIDSSGSASLGVGSGTVVKAHLVAMSSHGWLGGWCMGELWNQKRWYLIGQKAHDGKGFKGPLWVILAQCSTLNSACWPSWAKVLMASDPRVRGILGYEEVAPGARAATAIAKNFVDQLKAGTTFLDAWKTNNGGNNWAAIVHKEAVGDTLSALAEAADGKNALSDVTTTATLANYKGYLHSYKGGAAAQDILLVDPPFNFKIQLASGGNLYPEVQPWTLADPTAWLLACSAASDKAVYNNHEYQVTISLADGSNLKSVTLEWIHVRASKIRLDMKKIFKPAVAGLSAKTKMSGPATTIVTLDAPAASVTVSFIPQDEKDMTTIMANQEYHGDDKLVPHHSYLWLRVAVTPESGAVLSYDFRTHGLSWFGPPTLPGYA
jgi:hypothetical protein